jgi:hypothetical protein
MRTLDGESFTGDFTGELGVDLEIVLRDRYEFCDERLAVCVRLRGESRGAGGASSTMPTCKY